MIRETRAAIGLRTASSRPRIPGPIQGCTAHWNGPAMRLRGRPHSECRARWIGIQRFHMVERGWADVAYTFAVCHHGIAMDGRGKDVRTAANGTNAGNDRWYACFFMVGEGEEPSREMLAAADWYARVHLGVSTWNRHKDHKATDCAGTVDKYVVAGRLDINRAAPAGTMTPTPVPATRSFITVGDKGADVKAWQVRLQNWNADALPRFGADGDFGDETREWTVRFMREVGLISPSANPERPQVGPATMKAMDDLLTRRSDTVSSTPEPGPFPDVPGDHTHAEAIAKAVELELMQGYPDGTFRPERPLTRGQAAALLIRLHERVG